MSKKDYFVSSAKFLKLNLKVEYQNILEEAINLKDRFVYHKAKPYSHKGWKSLCLHGISEKHIDTWGDYGFKTASDAGDASMWTEISALCPHTMKFINNFPSNKFGRIRFEVLESAGYIDEHRQSRVPVLENIIVPLNSPIGYTHQWFDNEYFTPTLGYAYTTNIHYFYSISNNSKEDYYQLVIDRHDSTNGWKELISNACDKQQVTGEYFTHDIAT